MRIQEVVDSQQSDSRVHSYTFIFLDHAVEEVALTVPYGTLIPNE